MPFRYDLDPQTIKPFILFGDCALGWYNVISENEDGDGHRYGNED